MVACRRSPVREVLSETCISHKAAAGHLGRCAFRSRDFQASAPRPANGHSIPKTGYCFIRLYEDSIWTLAIIGNRSSIAQPFLPGGAAYFSRVRFPTVDYKNRDGPMRSKAITETDPGGSRILALRDRP